VDVPPERAPVEEGDAPEPEPPFTPAPSVPVEYAPPIADVKAPNVEFTPTVPDVPPLDVPEPAFPPPPTVMLCEIAVND
jgi:hypothetical protein